MAALAGAAVLAVPIAAGAPRTGAASPHDESIVLGPVDVAHGYELTVTIQQHGRYFGSTRDSVEVAFDRWRPGPHVTHTLWFRLAPGALRLGGPRTVDLHSGAALGRWGTLDLRFARPPRAQPVDIVAGPPYCSATRWRQFGGTLAGSLVLTTPIGTVRLHRIKAAAAASFGAVRCVAPPPRRPCPTTAPPSRGVRWVSAITTVGDPSNGYVGVEHLVPFGGAEDDFTYVPLNALNFLTHEPRAATAPATVTHAISVDIPDGTGTYADDETSIALGLDGIVPQLAGSLAFSTPELVSPPLDCAYHRGTLSGDATARFDWGGTVPLAPTPLPATIRSMVEPEGDG
jgi:hypothetical protein